MDCLQYRNAKLYMENVCLRDIAEQFGTPCYIYSHQEIEKNWQTFDNAFNKILHSTCYAVKANSNLAILSILAKLNSGFDIVSLGELERVLTAGGDPSKTFFSGVGKTKEELERALKIGIHCFNVESISELERLNQIAEKNKVRANIALRVNPNIHTKSHTHIVTGAKENKFGIEKKEVIPICKTLSRFSSLSLVGLSCHIGSQVLEIQPFSQAITTLIDIYKCLLDMNILLQHLNIGGGLGIVYNNENPPSISEYAEALQNQLLNVPIKLILEPGRAIVGNAGILLTRVEYLKENSAKNFAIVDAGMNDLLRPALYNAWQNILPVECHPQEKKFFDIMGPICESSDFLGKQRQLAIHEGDLLAITSVGAYGFSMSSNYNSRCRGAEILITNEKVRLIRRRETIKDLISLEVF